MTDNTVSKTPAIISVVLTILLLLLLGAFTFIINLVTLNGFSEREGSIALATLGICESAGLIISAILAGRLTNLFIRKYSWKPFLAGIVSIVCSIISGGIFYVIGFFLSVMTAEILH